MERREVSAGEYLFREGDVGDEAYLIASGKVDIIKDVGSQELVLATLKRGDIFGEMALIDDQPRMASAKISQNAVLTVIPRKDLKGRLEKLQKDDPVLRRLIDVLVQRIRTQN